jgi:NADPH:quinone reductase-like Zn-dependent oxidoreductase
MTRPISSILGENPAFLLDTDCVAGAVRSREAPGWRVLLVHGGADAVGLFAIQLARFRGAHVVSTASARNLAFVSNLGAEQVFDYQATRFDEKLSE